MTITVLPVGVDPGASPALGAPAARVHSGDALGSGALDTNAPRVFDQVEYRANVLTVIGLEVPPVNRVTRSLLDDVSPQPPWGAPPHQQGLPQTLGEHRAHPAPTWGRSGSESPVPPAPGHCRREGAPLSGGHRRSHPASSEG